MYGKALLYLNKSLQDQGEGLSTDTLCATVLLSFYEIITCTERNAWVQVRYHAVPRINQDPLTDTVSLSP